LDPGWQGMQKSQTQQVAPQWHGLNNIILVNLESQEMAELNQYQGDLEDQKRCRFQQEGASFP